MPLHLVFIQLFKDLYSILVMIPSSTPVHVFIALLLIMFLLFSFTILFFDSYSGPFFIVLNLLHYDQKCVFQFLIFSLPVFGDYFLFYFSFYLFYLVLIILASRHLYAHAIPTLFGDTTINLLLLLNPCFSPLMLLNS